MTTLSPIPHSRPTIGEMDRRAVGDCLASGMLTQGARVEELEARVAARLQQAAGVATGSGTAALVLALRGVGVDSGDVVLPSYACHAVADAVLSVGARPLLCDIGEDFAMTPDTVADVVTRDTRAIVVVHPFGIPVDTAAFRRFGVPLIDDACQAFGAAIPAGADVVCCSFHATKLLTTGEGGMALATDPSLASKMRELRDGARSSPRVRLPSPLGDVAAALGLSQLEQYDGFLARRRQIAEAYFEGLRGSPIELPHRVRRTSIFLRFPLRSPLAFEEARARFLVHGVHVRRGVDALIHRALGQEVRFPSTERTFDRTLSIPILPSMSDEDVTRVIEACRDCHAG